MSVMMPEGIEIVASCAVPKGMVIIGPKLPEELFLLPQDDVERWIEERRGEFAVIRNCAVPAQEVENGDRTK